MRLRHLILSAVFFSASALVARADTIFSYNITGSGNFGLNGTVSGTITIDVTTGMVQSVTFTTNSTNGTATFTGADSQVQPGSGPVVYVGGNGSATQNSTEARLSLDAGSLINYNTASDNSFDLRIPNGDAYVGHLTNGTQVTVAPTPEPSAIFLFGTGLLGVAGVVRKRFA